MDTFFSIFLFLIVLFIYIHICHQLHTNSDLDVYEVVNIPKDELDELCKSKQPILINNDYDPLKSSILNDFEKINILKIKKSIENSNEYIPFEELRKKDALSLFNKNSTNSINNHLYTSNNNEESNEAFKNSLIKKNSYFAPSLLSYHKSDILTGSKDSYTPLVYQIYNRNFLYVFGSDSAEITLIPPNEMNNLQIIKDYEILEFRSKINPWEDNDNDYKKIIITLKQGHYLFIPPFWNYSIKFGNNTKIHSFHYNTYISSLSILNHTILHYLQIQNTIEKYDSNNPIVFNKKIQKSFEKTKENNTKAGDNKKKIKIKKNVSFNNNEETNEETNDNRVTLEVSDN